MKTAVGPALQGDFNLTALFLPMSFQCGSACSTEHRHPATLDNLLLWLQVRLVPLPALSVSWTGPPELVITPAWMAARHTDEVNRYSLAADVYTFGAAPAQLLGQFTTSDVPAAGVWPANVPLAVVAQLKVLVCSTVSASPMK